ncbi:hypothetical protein DXG01_016437 [Tephrocybe rancida]|nr:hypothetical protein DXG01_016437 [Tephrocybe rancida]
MPAIRHTNSRNVDGDAPGLQVGAHRKVTRSSALRKAGHHFNRVVYAFSGIRSLIAQGLKCTAQLEGTVVNDDDDDSDVGSPEDWSAREWHEYAVYKELLDMCKGLEDKLTSSKMAEDIEELADEIQKGCSGSCSDDTKGMKGAVVDWITPPRSSLTPLINQRQKTSRGFYHLQAWTGTTQSSYLASILRRLINVDITGIRQKLISGEQITAGHQWPIFIYLNNDFDPNNPWKGLLRSELLVMAFKHVLIAPSAADKEEDMSTKSGNAKIHGMHKVTPASLVYVATQVRFALSSTSQWSRGDKVVDSENFYTSLLDVLVDPCNTHRINKLLQFWDQYVASHPLVIEPVLNAHVAPGKFSLIMFPRSPWFRWKEAL